jgi:hypothetical protein
MTPAMAALGTLPYTNADDYSVPISVMLAWLVWKTISV